ncbi:MAG: GNAT family N-acetyltransferase [Pseudomonadota bacterium]
MTAIEMTYTESDTKGRYGARREGTTEEAELTISKVSEKLIIVDHTFVPDTLRGQGLAGTLARRVIADARSKDQRIVPLCPFLRGYAEKHREELSDVIQW